MDRYCTRMFKAQTLKDKPIYPCTKSKIHCLVKYLCNFQVTFFIGITLALQSIFLDLNPDNWNNIQSIPEKGDVLYYGKKNLQVHYLDFARSVIHRLAIKPHQSSEVKVCDGKSFELHKTSGMGIRRTQIFQTLGDTNVHGISAFLDDRLNDKEFIRILALGLHPGPTDKLYCNYDCDDGKENMCSVAMSGVILPSGKETDYKDDDDRKSLKDVLYLTCPIRSKDNPTTVTLVTNQCGFSHNILNVSAFDTQGVVTPPRDIGICVRPLNTSRLPNPPKKEEFAIWLEFLRHIGGDQVHLYISHVHNDLKNTIYFYKNEILKLLTIKSWDVIENEVDLVVSDEAAVNDCINQNMMAYRYILVLSYGEIPVFSSKMFPNNLKQLVRNDDFKKNMDVFSGYRLQRVKGYTSPRQAMLLKTRQTLATAANHFIPLTGRPSFRILGDWYLKYGLIDQDSKNVDDLRHLVKKKLLH